jgi:hypothetical protein
MQYGTNGQLQTLAMPIEKRIYKEALLKAGTVLAAMTIEVSKDEQH